MNALSMAMTLDGGVDFSAARAAEAKAKADAEKAATQKPLPNQKVALLRALLSVGDLTSSLFFLANFKFLAGPFPEVADLLLRITEAIIDPIYQPYSISEAKPKLGGAFTGNRSRYSHTEQKIIAVPPYHAILSGLPGSTARPNIETRFFFAEWKDRLPIGCSADEGIATIVSLLRFVGPYAGRNLRFLNKLLRTGSAILGPKLADYVSYRYSLTKGQALTLGRCRSTKTPPSPSMLMSRRLGTT